MDIRTRVLTARLAEKIDGNREYSEKLHLKNTSHYRKHGIIDRKGEK